MTITILFDQGPVHSVLGLGIILHEPVDRPGLAGPEQSGQAT